VTDESLKQRRSGTRAFARYPLVLLAIFFLIAVATQWAPPAGRVSWWLEVGPGVLGIVILVAVYRRFPMSRFVYTLVFVHCCVLVYGGYYTYALTPLGNWARDAFQLSRNHYDRVGHLALGAFPAFVIREILLRLSPLRRGGWLYFLVVSVVLAIAAFWELLEWWVTLIAAPETGNAFLGSQGDIWDAQWDMFLAQVAAMIVLPLFGRLHDRSIEAIPPRNQ
jgi:putative membrane protein